MPDNLYVHFPFCRGRCSYCTLYSRAGTPKAVRDRYARDLVPFARGYYRTAYFGGGSPALADLTPLIASITADEFTVELHPLDVTDELLRGLRQGGVNRISMGVQSLDDAVLAHMGRGYTFDEAERAFALVRRYFDNAGIDLIVGYPGETAALLPRHARLARWKLSHCSVYALQNERNLPNAPDDETTMNRLRTTADFLGELGLRRYEISNYALPGRECRHNLAVWRGEDYLGIGEGACGRIGLTRTRGVRSGDPSVPFSVETETVSAESDAKERRLFRLRTREGLDATGFPSWLPKLRRFAAEGLLSAEGATYRLTPRGQEVCDTVLAELV